jgi:hypothetical protein
MTETRTDRIPAQRTTEQLVNEAASGRGLGAHPRPARGHGAEQRGLAYVPVSRSYEGRFGRMFRLPPFVPSAERIQEIADLMTEAEDAVGDTTLDNPTIPAGYTYFGQFIDHDLTFDPVSSLTRQTDPDALTNFRSPRFDLDCVYGRGPSDDAFMYDKAPGRSDMLLIGHHDNEDDLPRNIQHTALLGDPRNDENTFVSQLQLTMLKFHNAVVELVRGDPSLIHGSETLFEAAQRIVRWHYQWVVMHDFLSRTVGAETFAAVLDESDPTPRITLDYYRVKSNAYMPVEFSVAAYRFGHSQIRGEYKLNTLVGPLPTFLAGETNDEALKIKQFGGFRELPAFWTIEWKRFFEVQGEGDGQLQHSRLIDTLLSNPLKNLPKEIGGDAPSLIRRNLTRAARLALPSGQAVAGAMGVPALSTEDLALPGGGPAPLWYYILREAKIQAGGQHLGQVGGRIVAEVFLGLMEKDPSSYLHNEPGWKPFLPAATAGTFTMPDLITFSGHGLGITNLPGR